MSEPKEASTQGRVRVDDLPLRPNMLLTNARATSSTIASLGAEHCVVTGSNFFNSLFNRTNLEGCTFVACELDGALIENSSLRGVVLKNCDVDGLVINGVHVGALLRLLQGKEV
jgi:uncharacterized protein YjbI with pentapeptide repeats